MLEFKTIEILKPNKEIIEIIKNYNYNKLSNLKGKRENLWKRYHKEKTKKRKKLYIIKYHNYNLLLKN